MNTMVLGSPPSDEDHRYSHCRPAAMVQSFRPGIDSMYKQMKLGDQTSAALFQIKIQLGVESKGDENFKAILTQKSSCNC